MVAVRDVSCRRGPTLRRRWAEFPLVRAGDGKADVPDKRPFMGRPREEEVSLPLFNQSLTGYTKANEGEAHWTS